MKGTTLYLETPTVTASTPTERLSALQDAKKLMSGSEPGGFAAMFSASAAGPGSSTNAIDGFLRLAEYITTGHDYKDTHPKGKRRPLINDTHVTVMAPPSMDQDDIDHLISHIEDGSFAEFMRDMVAQQEAAHGANGDANTMEAEMKARAAEGLPTDGDADTTPEDRPRFGSKASDFS